MLQKRHRVANRQAVKCAMCFLQPYNGLKSQLPESPQVLDLNLHTDNFDMDLNIDVSNPDLHKDDPTLVICILQLVFHRFDLQSGRSSMKSSF